MRLQSFGLLTVLLLSQASVSVQAQALVGLELPNSNESSKTTQASTLPSLPALPSSEAEAAPAPSLSSPPSSSAVTSSSASSTLEPSASVTEAEETSEVEAEPRTTTTQAPEARSVTTGKWGTCPWQFDSDTGIVTMGAGNAGAYYSNPWRYKPTVKKIVFTGKVVLRNDSKEVFYLCSNLQTIEGLSNLDTSKVTNMSYMFYKCSSLTSLDLSQWDTSNVTNMSYMFNNCSSLTSLDVSQWDTSKVTNMSYMFYNCSSLTSLDVSQWDTSKVTSMANMFDSCSSLTSLDVSQWDTSNVTNMDSMFSNCSSLTSLNMSQWNTPKLIEISQMFFNCSSLTSLDLSQWDTSKVTNMFYLFNNCSSLTSLDVSQWNVSNVTEMNSIFFNCSSLTSLDVSQWDTSKVTNMSYMFSGCSSLTSLDVSHFDASKVTKITDMLDGMSLERLTLGDKFKFVGGTGASLGAPKSDAGTGKWIREDGNSIAYTPYDFMTKYGTGDLTAGTYVAELANQAKLNLTYDASSSTRKSQVGDFPIFIFKLAHDSSSQSTAKSIRISNLNSLKLGGAYDLDPEVLVDLYKEGNNEKVSNVQPNFSNSVSLPDLAPGYYYLVSFPGYALNNTIPEEESNYSLDLSYQPTDSNTLVNKTLKGKLDIASGPLKFSKVPKTLNFETTMLKEDLNNQLIKRQEKSWGITISDLRGNNPYGENHQVDRQNWELLATASPFKEGSGEEVPTSVLATTYVKGSQQEDLNEEETKLESHDVSGESPTYDSDTTFKASETEGLQAVVYDYRRLNGGKKYQSTLTFELRNAP